jgi:hypothetical protein
MQEAHARSLVLDLDGITSQSTYHFLSGFGGIARPRMMVVPVLMLAIWVNSAAGVVSHETVAAA